jgi:hypothetical protein
MTTIAGVVVLKRRMDLLVYLPSPLYHLSPPIFTALSFITAFWYVMASIAENRKRKWTERKEYLNLKKQVEQIQKKQWEEVKEVHKQIDWKTGKRELFE